MLETTERYKRPASTQVRPYRGSYCRNRVQKLHLQVTTYHLHSTNRILRLRSILTSVNHSENHVFHASSQQQMLDKTSFSWYSVHAVINLLTRISHINEKKQEAYKLKVPFIHCVFFELKHRLFVRF